MIIIPDERIRKYISYSVEEKMWMHDSDMPDELEPVFQYFCEMARKYNYILQNGFNDNHSTNPNTE